VKNLPITPVFAALACFGPASAPAADGPEAKGSDSRPVAFVNVRVVPMDRERVAEGQTVVVRDGRIAEIGPADAVKVPAGVLRVDGGGKYLMPGLVDMHVHLNSPHEFPLFLANGVTTVYNLNGRPAHLLWRDRVRDGRLTGPTIYTCGPTIRFADKADESRKMVEEQAKAGYDSIKIYVRISKEAYPVLVETARRHNMLVVGHIPRGPGLEGVASLEAVLKGRQAIAHAEEYIYSFFNDKVNDDSRLPAAVAATREAGVPVILTLVAYDHILRQAEDLPAFLARPETKYLAPWVRQTWGPGVNSYNLRFSPPEKQQYLRSGLALQKKLVRELHKAGVRIFTGTDAMNPGVVPGFSLHEELHNLVELGFTPFEALQAATSNPAEFFHSPAEFGTVAVGQRADLLLTDGNPLKDVATVAHPAGVMSRGRWLPAEKLRSALDGVAAAFARDEEFARSNVERDLSGVLAFLEQNDPFDGLASQLLFDVATSERGVERFRTLCDRLKKEKPGAPLLSEDSINQLGYRLLQSDRNAEALGVLRQNVDAHPKSANAYDSLAEAYLKSGDKESAVRYYKKALEVDPLFGNAAEMLKRLGAAPNKTPGDRKSGSP
jgi:imidazolonepropionase-like amidohydrolase